MLLLNKASGRKNDFNSTQIFHFHQNTSNFGYFKQEGSLFQLSDSEKQHIQNGNFCFVEDYCEEQLDVEGRHRRFLHALIIGTNDKIITEQIRYSRFVMLQKKRSQSKSLLRSRAKL